MTELEIELLKSFENLAELFEMLSSKLTDGVTRNQQRLTNLEAFANALNEAQQTCLTDFATQLDALSTKLNSLLDASRPD